MRSREVCKALRRTKTREFAQIKFEFSVAPATRGIFINLKDYFADNLTLNLHTYV